MTLPTAARLRLASPDEILRWSAGEVTKPDTLHPRSGKPVPGGLFCEDTFGPLHEYRCRCGKLTGQPQRRRTCRHCLTPVLQRRGRRRKMGHVELAAPVAHVWFVKARPSPIAVLLGLRPGDVERIVQGEAYLIGDGDRAGEVIGRDEAEDSPHRSRTGAAALEHALRALDLDALDAQLRAQLAGLGGSPDSTRRQEILRRLRLVNGFRRSKIMPHWMILRRLPVVGPALRPVVKLDSGRHASSELNGLYARVIARNNRLRELLGQPTPSSILRIEQRQLQIAVDALLDNARCDQPVMGPRRSPVRSLSDLLGGKQGRFRGNLLGKRVDYSARSVIVVGPELKLHEVGLPHAVVLGLFEPLLLGQLRREGWCRTLKRGKELLHELLYPERMIAAARRVVRELARLAQIERATRVKETSKDPIAVKEALETLDELDTHDADVRGRRILGEFDPTTIDRLRESLRRDGRAETRRLACRLLEARQEQLWDLVRRVVTGHPVLLNRAPTLHRMGIQAFEPVLVEGNAIRLHPLVCKAFNADFDGDQMAVHLPLSEEAISEAYERMTPARNLFNPASGQPIVTPGQDVVLGCYYLTTTLPQLQRQSGKVPILEGEAPAEPRSRRNPGSSGSAGASPSTPGSPDGPPPPLSFTPPQTDHGGGRAFAGPDEVRLAHDLGKLGPHARIRVRWPGSQLIDEADDKQVRHLAPHSLVDTTAGRTLFNAALPPGLPFYNLSMTSRRLARVLADCHRKHGPDVTVELLDRLKEIGFEAATRSGVSFATDDVPLPRNKADTLREAFARVASLKRGLDEGNVDVRDYPTQLLDAWDAAHKKITQTLMPDLRHDTRDGKPYLNPLCVMADSGARGSPEQIRQLAGLRGLMASISGRVIERPITASLREGLRSWDYFVSAYGSRKGLTDKGIRTAEAGYLTRKLVDAAQQVIVTEPDCGSLLGMLKRAPVGTLGGRVTGRVSLERVAERGELVIDVGELISPGQARRLAEMGRTELRVRSPLTCRAARGVCQRCYGVDLATGRLVEVDTAVGVIAAQSIGEPGTQLTLKTFQGGGVAGKDVVSDLERVTRLLEVSPVDDPVPLAPRRAEVRVTRYHPGQRVAACPGWWLDESGADEILRINKRRVRFEQGQRVEPGTPLCEGDVDLRQMLALGGSDLVGDHLLERVRKLFREHWLEVDDRHFEVILSRMLGSVIVRDAGDTDLLPGEVLSRPALVAINRALAKGQRPAYARTWILGVSQAAARAQGFLAAASFQRAVKVLSDAAIAASRDELLGPKENVILGRPIPAGSGLGSRR